MSVILCRTVVCMLPLCAFAAGAQTSAPTVFGYHDFAQQAKWEASFLAVPDPRLAGEDLKALTAVPHWASSPEDYRTALYVADKFRAAGLKTEIVPYRVRLNKPLSILIEAFDASGKKIMTGPTAEYVDPSKDGGDPYQNDPRILPAFNGSSPSGDVTGEVVYANYGTLRDFRKLARDGISVRGKIVLTRYGNNFRGVKAYIAQKYGAVGILIYSDPADDGHYKGETYPKGPYRPASGVQRGSVQFLPIYPGDPETPGIASTLDLPTSKRLSTKQQWKDAPRIPSNPLSYQDALPILKALGGAESSHGWQIPPPGSQPGPGKVTVHMQLRQDSRLRTIWNVIGIIPGTDWNREWVIAGNHRDAWVYGAVDPSSGTVAMLQAVRGLGELLKQGWKPRRTIVIGSWDAEEEGLVGSTEWVEQHMPELSHAVAYFNTDIAVSGPSFNASAVPSLKEFLRDVARAVPSPEGGTVYDHWKGEQRGRRAGGQGSRVMDSPEDAYVGDLGSGSDYTPFLQHAGVPSTDIGSSGPYGVYHSVFDNYNWFVKFADPTFVYEQQQARFLGLEVLRMADAEVLPYDDALYGREIVSYLSAAQERAAKAKLTLDFAASQAAAARFAAAGVAIRAIQMHPPAETTALNEALRAAEEALLNPEGLPIRPWYKHMIYAPGEFTGYAAVVIPGVTEGIDAGNASRTQIQLAALAVALNRAASILEAVK